MHFFYRGYLAIYFVYSLRTIPITMFTFQNNLKELPQVGVILPSSELDSAASMRGDIFIMETYLGSLYERYHLQKDIQSKLELALEIHSINKVNRMPEYWHDCSCFL